ncbi:hypothetical protein NCS52_00253700 [Fusarium sp. LHS14.1]|nr:hypothetical protein NCS52_00253700 [Fusarium sp. LHS14.1]
MATKILLAALLAVPAIAKTDLSGCTSYDSILFQGNSPYVSKIYYVPDTGEVCEFLDCGGGRAPPKTTVPGCDSYEGTETYSPRFINPKTLGEVASETDAAGSETEDSTATITEAPSSTKAVSKTTAESEEETTAEDEETTTAEDTTAEETTAVEQTTTTKDASSTITTITTQGTPAAGFGAASSGSESESEAAATPASTVSTGGAVMPTAGAFLGSCLMAGAMYAGLL